MNLSVLMTKHFLGCLLFLFFTLSACQQQYVPEVSYDLDAKSILGQTRNTQVNRILLYQAKEIYPTNHIQQFEGYITAFRLLDQKTMEVNLVNIMGLKFKFNIDLALKKQLSRNMSLVVRYIEKDAVIKVIEIRKED